MAKVTITLEDAILANADGRHDVDVDIQFDPPLGENAKVRELTSSQTKALLAVQFLTAPRQ